MMEHVRKKIHPWAKLPTSFFALSLRYRGKKERWVRLRKYNKRHYEDGPQLKRHIRWRDFRHPLTLRLRYCSVERPYQIYYYGKKERGVILRKYNDRLYDDEPRYKKNIQWADYWYRWDGSCRISYRWKKERRVILRTYNRVLRTQWGRFILAQDYRPSLISSPESDELLPHYVVFKL